MKKLQILLLFVMLALASAASIKAQITPYARNIAITARITVSTGEPPVVVAYSKSPEGTTVVCPLAHTGNGVFTGECRGLASVSVDFFTINSTIYSPQNVNYALIELSPPQKKRFRISINPTL